MAINDAYKNFSFIQFLLFVIRPFYWQLSAIVFVACFWAAHISLQPYVVKMILDQANIDPSFIAMLSPILSYIMVSLGSTFNTQLYDFACIHFYPKLKANIIAFATEQINKQSYTFFQTQMSGTLATKVKDLTKGTADIIQIFLDQFFSHTLALLFACVALVAIHPLLSVILFAWAILFIIISFVSTRRARILAHHLSEANSTTIGYIVDCFANILNLKLFVTQKHEQAQLLSRLDQSITLDKELRWFLLKVIALQGFITTLMISGCLVVLIFSVHSHHITVGDFGLVLTLTLSIADALWNLAQEISKFSESYGLVIQGITLLNTKPEIINVNQAQELLVTKGEVTFKNVHFTYSGAENLFKDKCITIAPKEKVGLVGYSGSGKSTFINLILRLFDIQSGQIIIDGQNIAHVTLESLYRSITVIPQSTTLFHRTIKENIKYGKLDASEQDIIRAAQHAHAHDFIMQLPQQYDTLVGERGGKLSGGQQQRIIIARAFLKNSPILILDEATSALDAVTEKLIHESLLELMHNKTTFIIAHRLTTLQNLDRIIVFSQGKIVEDGSHDFLLTKGTLYPQLWSTQQNGTIANNIQWQ